MKEKKTLFMWILLVIFFGLDALYWYGYDEDIDFVVNNAFLILFFSFFGFLLSFFYIKKTKFKILFLLGIVLNIVLMSLWYIFKDFGF